MWQWSRTRSLTGASPQMWQSAASWKAFWSVSVIIVSAGLHYLTDLLQFSLDAYHDVFHGFLPTAEDKILSYTIAANHYIAVAAWDLLCDLPCVAFFWIACTAFYGDVQRFEVGIDDYGTGICLWWFVKFRMFCPSFGISVRCGFSPIPWQLFLWLSSKASLEKTCRQRRQGCLRGSCLLFFVKHAGQVLDQT